MLLHRRSTILGGAALAAGAAAPLVPARAQLTIDMTRPSFEPVPIAIVDFAGDRVGADIAGVVRNDLQGSGLFRSIAPSATELVNDMVLMTVPCGPLTASQVGIAVGTESATPLTETPPGTVELR